MISVDEAWDIIDMTAPLDETQVCALCDAVGRVLAAPIIANRTQPPRDMSAMDGYAVAFSDIESGLEDFAVIGEAPAGGAFDRPLTRGEAVRIFTGGVVPDGADHVVIQEDVAREGDKIRLIDRQAAPRHIRKAGQDFATHDVLLPAAHRLTPGDIGLIANGNHGSVTVLRRPRIALIASGDELVPPGQEMSDTQIPNSNSPALAALLESWGAEVVANVLVKDDKDIFTTAIKELPPVDIIVPIGGASVGDYDYAKDVFFALGYQSAFEKIAVKPGKPCWFAKGDTNLVLGLPGNPGSAMVTAHLFLHPLIDRLAGLSATHHWLTGCMAHELAGNGGRETYLRGNYHVDAEGRVQVSTLAQQDSGMTTTFAAASCLVRIKPDAAALAQSERVTILPL